MKEKICKWFGHKFDQTEKVMIDFKCNAIHKSAFSNAEIICKRCHKIFLLRLTKNSNMEIKLKIAALSKGELEVLKKDLNKCVFNHTGLNAEILVLPQADVRQSLPDIRNKLTPFKNLIALLPTTTNYEATLSRNLI